MTWSADQSYNVFLWMTFAKGWCGKLKQACWWRCCLCTCILINGATKILHLHPQTHVHSTLVHLTIKLSRFPSLAWSRWHELLVTGTPQWSLWTGQLLLLLGSNRCWIGVKGNAKPIADREYHPGMEWLPLTLRSGRSTRHLLLWW